MNTKKILGIFICMLVMTMIPVAAGATINQNPQPSRIGWTTIQGIMLTQPKTVGGTIYFTCVLVHYVCQGLTQRQTGFKTMGMQMVIPETFHGLLANHIIIGWCPGAIEF